MMKSIFLLFGLWVVANLVSAQQPYTWQDFAEEMANDELAEQEDWAEQMEELALLAEHPIDINTATREQLRMLPFLTDEQIEEIHAYIFRHRGMRSLGELMAIPSIDFRTRQYLSLFLWADPTQLERRDTLRLKTILWDSRHELTTRLDIPLYYRIGYSYPSQQGGYKGSTLYNNVRYRMTDNKHLALGLSAEKDQGEPFRGNGGWDHYGGYLMMRNLGKVRAALVGDYKLGFGEGLAVNTGFSAGKSSLMGHPSQGIRAKQGMDEVNYFRGAALTLGGKHVEATVWFSHRRLDATLDTDGNVTTLLSSGLHRTTTELSKKHNLSTSLAGGNITWRSKGFSVGATGYYQRFQHSLSPGNALYRRIYPRGRHFGVASLNYGYNHPKGFSLSGETAYSTERGGWATLNRTRWKISPRYTLSGAQRFYSYRYYSFHASALAENSRVQNESGATLRLDATPVSQLAVMVYTDFFYNPWPRYGLTHSSQGMELCTDATYSLRQRNKFALRYQLKRKERNDLMETHNRLRLTYTRQQGKVWLMQSQFHLHTLPHTAPGWAVSQSIRGKWSRGGGSALLTYFHTPEYATRLFQYEPTLSGMFRFPSLYGHGMRFEAMGSYTIWHGMLQLEALYSFTRYLDRQIQGKGMQEIRSPWKHDISVQLKLRI